MVAICSVNSSSMLQKLASFSASVSPSENFLHMAKRTMNTVDVNAEYSKAFHTKSFVDIWSKARRELLKSSAALPPQEQLLRHGAGIGKLPPRSQSPLPHRSYTHLPDFLLEPSQDSLIAAAAAAGGRGAAVLLDYLDTTVQSFTACASLLAAIDRVRSLRRAICRLLPGLPSSSSAATDLSSYLELGNPLSPQNLPHFYSTHALYPPLLCRLTAARRRLRRQARAVRIAKSVSGMAVIAAVGAAAAAALVLATHGVMAMAAAAAAPLLAVRVRRPQWAEGVRLGRLKRAGRRVDAAARGAYIVRRDLDTLSRMVRRAHGEVEHGRDVAGMALRCCREEQLVREVAREMEMEEDGLQEQLEELEEHVCLCLLTINRSRRLVSEELQGVAGD